MRARSRKSTRWLSHRRLVLLEALLLVGAVDLELENRVLASGFADELKVAFSMLLVLGFFGSFVFLAERVATTGVGKTHQTIRSLPIPTPRILIHGAVLCGLFLAYARVLDLWPSWVPF